MFPSEPRFEYKSFKKELDREVFFILGRLETNHKKFSNISKNFFIPYPIPKFFKEKCIKILYSFISLKDLQISKSFMIRFGIRFPEICFEISSTFSYPLKFTAKSKTLNIYSKIRESH